MNSLFFADPHWTDNQLDFYRFAFVHWLFDVIEEYKVKKVYCLGDLTEKKDRHSEILINEIKDIFLGLSDYADVFIIAGNHDSISKSTFRFLNNFPKVSFFDRPIKASGTLFLPHTRNPLEDWKDINLNNYDYILMHQTVDGVLAQNGHPLTSKLGKDFFDNTKATVFSGDIHNPQKIGKVEYIGSPYPVYFGDKQEGRILIIDDKGKRTELHFPTIKKLMLDVSSVEDLEKYEIRENDQAKIRVNLTQDVLYTYSNIKADISTYMANLGAKIANIELKIKTIEKEVTGKQQEAKTKYYFIRQLAKDFDEIYLKAAMGIIDETKQTAN